MTTGNREYRETIDMVFTIPNCSIKWLSLGSLRMPSGAENDY
jgi:hypothetical protein